MAYPSPEEYARRAKNRYAADKREASTYGRKIVLKGSVPEHALYGTYAVLMLRYGFCEEAHLREYRSNAFLARRAFYGTAAAYAWEAEQLERHRAAVEALKGMPPATPDEPVI